MSNPLPLPATPGRKGSPPNSIEPRLYPALEQLRDHCTRDGIALIDRVYAEALALHKRAKAAEDELALYVEPALAEHARQENAMMDFGKYEKDQALTEEYNRQPAGEELL